MHCNQMHGRRLRCRSSLRQYRVWGRCCGALMVAMTSRRRVRIPPVSGLPAAIACSKSIRLSRAFVVARITSSSFSWTARPSLLCVCWIKDTAKQVMTVVAVQAAVAMTKVPAKPIASADHPAKRARTPRGFYRSAYQAADRLVFDFCASAATLISDSASLVRFASVCFSSSRVSSNSSAASRMPSLFAQAASVP